MGYQTSRIIWGKTKQNPDDDGNTDVPVSDYDPEIIYTSGNLVIYEKRLTPSKTEVGVFQCMVEEICNKAPEYSFEGEWKQVKGVPLFKIQHIPGAPSDVIERINTDRASYSPGARVITENVNGSHTLYKCKEKTNVYLEGFLYSKWEKVTHRPGTVYIPKDHHSVYYDDGKNKNKWHHGMYYMPDDPQDYEEEVGDFSEYTSYSKGEMALYVPRGTMETKNVNSYNAVYEYTYHIPSTPTRTNSKGEIEYSQPTPFDLNYWKYIETIQFFDVEKSYVKGDRVVWNSYSDEDAESNDGRGWTSVPITIFREDFIYKIGQRCLFRIKPTEEGNVSDKDIEKLIEHGDYEMAMWDEDFPEDLIPVPVTSYGDLIENNFEIYGVYEYAGVWVVQHGERVCVRDYKPRGYAFSNDEWNLIPEIKMISDQTYGPNCYIIAPYNESYAVYKTKQAANWGEYITPEDFEIYGLKAARYGHFYFLDEVIEKPDGGFLKVGMPTAPQDLGLNEYASNIWTIIKQRQYDPSRGPRVYTANKPKRYGYEFNRNDWTITTQKKFQRDTLYGWIWKKFTFGSGGTPFGALVPIPSITNNNEVRFNTLAIYRGDNVLEIGPLGQGSVYDSYYNWTMKIIGQTAWFYNSDTFFIKEHFGNNWYSFSLSAIIKHFCPFYGRSHYINHLEYRKDGVILFRIPSSDYSKEELWKITLVDYKSKTYGGSKQEFERIVYTPHFNIMDGYTYPGMVTGVNGDANCKYFYLPCSDFYNATYDIGFEPNVCLIGSTTCLKCNIIYNDNGDIAKLSVTSDRDQRYEETPSTPTSSGAHLKVSDVITDEIDTYMKYMLEDLAEIIDDYEGSKSYCTWKIYEDGWQGDLNSPDTEIYERRRADRLSQTLFNIGVSCSTTEEEHECARTYDPVYERYYIGFGSKVLNYRHPRIGNFCLYPQFNEEYHDDYHFPEHYIKGVPFYDWVGSPPLFAGFTFYSQDGQVIYTLNCLYGMFAKRLDSHTTENDICMYSLAFLDVTRQGVTTSYEIIRNKRIGCCIYDQAYGMYRTFYEAAGDVICYGNKINVIMYDDNYIYIIKPTYSVTYETVIGIETENIMFAESTGLWIINFNTYKEQNQESDTYKTKTDFSLIPVNTFTEPIQALFKMCWIEKIPYYKYQTCHIDSLNRDIKYLSINFGDMELLSCNYVNAKLQEWEESDCITMNVNMWEHLHSPTITADSNTIVTNSDDIIIIKPYGISGKGQYSSESRQFWICVVLPNFKSAILNFATTASKTVTAVTAYDPIVYGAFFWITSDNPYGMADPQYGGPEAGAKGFSGW